MHDNNSNNPWIGQERRNTPTIQDLMSRLDNHFRDENKGMMEFAQKVSSIENDMKIVSESMRKMTEVLERLAMAEERDRTLHQQIVQIKADNSDMSEKVEDSRDKLNKMPSGDEFYALKDNVNKWIYIGVGVSFCLTVLGGIVGSFLNTKLIEYDMTINAAKTHMALDNPVGWPPGYQVPQQNQQNK